MVRSLVEILCRFNKTICLPRRGGRRFTGEYGTVAALGTGQ